MSHQFYYSIGVQISLLSITLSLSCVYKCSTGKQLTAHLEVRVDIPAKKEALRGGLGEMAGIGASCTSSQLPRDLTLMSRLARAHESHLKMLLLRSGSIPSGLGASFCFKPKRVYLSRKSNYAERQRIALDLSVWSLMTAKAVTPTPGPRRLWRQDLALTAVLDCLRYAEAVRNPLQVYPLQVGSESRHLYLGE